MNMYIFTNQLIRKSRKYNTNGDFTQWNVIDGEHEIEKNKKKKEKKNCD